MLKYIAIFVLGMIVGFVITIVGIVLALDR